MSLMEDHVDCIDMSERKGKEILFSILIPAYKVNYLKECIDSILSQTFANFEIIIVDDASPYDIWSVVSQYDDNRIHYYRNEIGFGAYNVVGNWNKCLEYASGNYVICMGDDDRLLPCCLEEYYQLISKYPELNVYHAWTQIIDENGEVVKILQPRPEKESFYQFTYYRWTGRLQYIGDFCFKTQHLNNHNGFYELPLAWGADDITVARAALIEGIANTLKPCFEYRDNSLTISNSSKDVEIKLQSSLKEFQWYETIFSNIDKCMISDTDLWYLNELMKIRDISRRRMMLNEIMKDIRINCFNLLKWLVKCPCYHIKKIDLLKRVAKDILYR